MWPLIIIIVDPFFCDYSDLLYTFKQISIQNVLAIGPVKAFNVSILTRLARLNMLYCYFLFPTPICKYCTDKLRTIIYPYLFGFTIFMYYSFERCNNTVSGEAKI